MKNKLTKALILAAAILVILATSLFLYSKYSEYKTEGEIRKACENCAQLKQKNEEKKAPMLLEVNKLTEKAKAKSDEASAISDKITKNKSLLAELCAKYPNKTKELKDASEQDNKPRQKAFLKLMKESGDLGMESSKLLMEMLKLDDEVLKAEAIAEQMIASYSIRK